MTFQQPEPAAERGVDLDANKAAHPTPLIATNVADINHESQNTDHHRHPTDVVGESTYTPLTTANLAAHNEAHKAVIASHIAVTENDVEADDEKVRATALSLGFEVPECCLPGHQHGKTPMEKWMCSSCDVFFRVRKCRRRGLSDQEC
ncbi:hypothetical protein K432DRAFT_401946 [Lepidopterella palustris CBS 459.81]|uniref:Uncharacterized protein n=1 Tax=Lepidopterella palustris CBS 459.81 TaxID=1314670 RepID=A0A8E2JIR0_9PEZI|nr:hypothetical protein K432DRAFT_401946 [Lepidopterella palustris CBS 459.81]